MNVLRKLGGGRIGRFVWGGLAVAMGLALLLCTSMQERAEERERANAEQVAQEKVRTALFQALTPQELTKPILGPSFRDLLIVVQAEFLADPAIGRVRIWQPDGTLIFSTQERDGAVDPDETTTTQIDDAIAGRTTSVVTDDGVARGDEIRPVRTSVLKTVTAIRVPNRVASLAAAEIATFESSIVAAAAQPWRTLRIVFGLCLLLGIVMAFVAVRWPVAAESGTSQEGTSSRLAKLSGAGAAVAERRAAKAEARDLQRIDRAEQEAARAKKDAGAARKELIAARAELDEARSAGDVLREQLDDERTRRESIEERIASLQEQVREAEASRAWLEAKVEADQQADDVDPEQLRELQEQVRLAEESARVADERAREAEERANEAEQRARELAARMADVESERAELQDEFLNGSSGLESLERRIRQAEDRARHAEEVAMAAEQRTRSADV